ncbi:GNAT family N-acetyltransferase [Bordetella sp. LUAb4]|uniref:GNAT family N-acetyltransferase n=1 Tax=Bordetella sp. LUAb4 TaxID=2843195 RepID=UPI001E3DD647|nr:GNAT family N-acetyltransferase [Bordetella sp. LUAb4]
MRPLAADIRIESDRLVLKPFSAADADEAYACITPTLTRYMTWDPPASRAEYDSVWRDTWGPALAAGTDVIFVVRRREDGEFQGVVGIQHITDGSAEIGIWMREDRHGQGTGRAAAHLAAQWANSDLGITHFTYPVAEQNTASRRIAESLGGVVAEQRNTPKYAGVVYHIAMPATLR